MQGCNPDPHHPRFVYFKFSLSREVMPNACVLNGGFDFSSQLLPLCVHPAVPLMQYAKNTIPVNVSHIIAETESHAQVK